MAQTVYCSYANESWYFSGQIRRVAAAATTFVARADDETLICREGEARARVFTAQRFTNATCMHADAVPPWLAGRWMNRLRSDATEIRFLIGAAVNLARSIDHTAAAAGSYFPAPFMLAHAVPPLCASSSSCSSLLAALLLPCTCRQ